MSFSSHTTPIYLDPPLWDQQQQKISNQESDPLQIGSGGPGQIKPGSMVDRARQAMVPLPEAGLRCPRCDSTNTKFCYFNNYNLSQPRHFCKGCRRYWTRGGTLRNVPVGGTCRRNKRRKPKKPQTNSKTPLLPSSPPATTNNSSPRVVNDPTAYQLFFPPPDPFFPGMNTHLNGYVGGLGYLDQQMSNLIAGPGGSLYPYYENNTTGFGQVGGRGLKVEENHQGYGTDQFITSWAGDANGWAVNSGFHSSSS